MNEQASIPLSTPRIRENWPIYMLAISLVANAIVSIIVPDGLVPESPLFFYFFQNIILSKFCTATVSLLLAFALFGTQIWKSKESRLAKLLPIVAYAMFFLSFSYIVQSAIHYYSALSGSGYQVEAVDCLFLTIRILCFPPITLSLITIGLLKRNRKLVFYSLACLLPGTTLHCVEVIGTTASAIRFYLTAPNWLSVIGFVSLLGEVVSSVALLGAEALFIIQGVPIERPPLRSTFQSTLGKRYFRPTLLADIVFTIFSVALLSDRRSVPIIALAITRALLVLPSIPGRLKDLGLPGPLAILGAIPILGTIMMVPLSLADRKRAVEDPQANEEEQALRFANENPRIGIHCIAHLLIIFTLFPVFTMGQKGGGALLASFLFYLIIAEICHRRMRNSVKHEKAYFITSIVFYTLIALTPLVLILPACRDSDLLSMLGETYAGMFSTDESQYENVFDLLGQIGSSGAIAPALTSMAWCVYFTFIPILHLLNSRHERPGSRGSTSSSSNPPAAD